MSQVLWGADFGKCSHEQTLKLEQALVQQNPSGLGVR